MSGLLIELPIITGSAVHLRCGACLLADVIPERLGGKELETKEFKCSHHAVERAAQRNLSCEDIQYVAIYGKKYHLGSALVFFLRRVDVPKRDCTEDRWTRLEGTSVIMTKDGCTVITVWRNRRNGLKRIEKKSKRNTRPVGRSSRSRACDKL